jgi:dihydrofolate reductase
MRTITVVNHVTLDGVMQSPGGPDEDRRGGFELGGWAQPYGDEVMGRVMGEHMSGDGALLFGRFTYEKFFEVWPGRTDNPFTPLLNARTKYVVSTTLSESLPWENSVLLGGDAAAAVAELKDQPGPDLAILGSGELIRSLLPHGLIDRFLLTIHPLVLGRGRRLFADAGEVGAHVALELVETQPTTTGVIIATYRSG